MHDIVIRRLTTVLGGNCGVGFAPGVVRDLPASGRLPVQLRGELVCRARSAA